MLKEEVATMLGKLPQVIQFRTWSWDGNSGPLGYAMLWARDGWRIHKELEGDFPAVQWLRLCTPQAEGMRTGFL